MMTSLAGRVRDPRLPPGRVRVGGFGGVPGLVIFIRRNRVEAIVDATHPFAVRISEIASTAGEQTGVPVFRLTRPSWRTHPAASTWSWVDATSDVLGVARAARRPFLTTGRQTLGEFLPWAERHVLARVVDPPDFETPPRWSIIRSRGPYELGAEQRLMRDHRADLLVTKDSGGELTSAKLDAAAQLQIPIVVIARPATGTAAFTSVEEVLAVLP
jgi:precorrin-6A/cobalt-precorrin-6A reductase